MNPEFQTDRPANGQLIQRLRSDPNLLNQVLDYHVNQKPLDFKSIPSAAFWIRSLVKGPDNGAVVRDALTRAPAQVCGKKLRTGDIAFRCLTCAMDPTCILCRTCFENSPCRNHEYRMLSAGGGACDCGDPGAWKPEGFCKLHQGQREEDLLKMVPQNVRKWLEPATRYAVLLFARIALFVRAQNKDTLPSGSEPSPLCLSAPSMLKELVDIAMISDDGKRIVSNALSSNVLSDEEERDLLLSGSSKQHLNPLKQMLFAPTGAERKADFRPEAAKRRARDSGDIDDLEDEEDEDDFDFDDDDGAVDGDDDIDALLAAADNEDGEDQEEVTGDTEFTIDGLDLEGLDLDAIADGDENDEELAALRQLVAQIREAQRQNNNTNNNNNQRSGRNKKKRKNKKQKDNNKQSALSSDAAATASNTVATSSNQQQQLLSLAATAAGATTLQNLSFTEMLLTMDLCPFTSSPLFSQAWQGVKALFDACCVDTQFRRSFVRAVSRVALPWASCNAKASGLFSVGVQCLTVQPVVDEYLVPQQNIADSSHIMSSMLSAVILQFSASDAIVPVGDSSERIYQLQSKGLNTRAFSRLSAETYHPMMVSTSARAECLLSRPLLRAYITLLTLMHYNHFSRQESAPPLPRTSWDMELTNIRHLLGYGKGAAEIAKALLNQTAVFSSDRSHGSPTTLFKKQQQDLDKILGIRRDLLEHIFSDCTLHPVFTRLEKRNAAFSSIINSCSVTEPFNRTAIASSTHLSSGASIAEFLSWVLQEAFTVVGKHERALARKDNRTSKVQSWNARFSPSNSSAKKMAQLISNNNDDQDFQDDGNEDDDSQVASNNNNNGGTKSIRLLQRPYELLRQRNALGFHYPGIRFISCVIIATLRAFNEHHHQNNNNQNTVSKQHQQHQTNKASDALQSLILQHAITSAVSKASEQFPDTICNLIDRVVMTQVLAAQQLDNLWKRDYAGYTPHLHYYQNFDPSYFAEFDHFFLQCMAAGISAKLVSAVILERFSYTPQEDRIDEKAIPFGYAHFLRMVLCIATDASRTCGNYRAELRQRILIRLAVSGSEVRSRISQGCMGSEMDEEDSKHGEDIFQEALTELSTASRRKDATTFSLKESAWEQVPVYTGSTPPSFASLARNVFNEHQRKTTADKQNKRILPVAKTAGALHGPAFRDTLPLILHEEETISVALFILFSRACGVDKNKHPKMNALARKWRNSPKPLTISPTAMCTAIDTLAVATESVFDLLGRYESKSKNPNNKKNPIDWRKFEEKLSALRNEQQWTVVKENQQQQQQGKKSSTTDAIVSNFKPLKLRALSLPQSIHHVASMLLQPIEGVTLNAFKYYGTSTTCDFSSTSFLSNLASLVASAASSVMTPKTSQAREDSSPRSEKDQSNNSNSNSNNNTPLQQQQGDQQLLRGIDILELLLEHKDPLLADVSATTESEWQLEKAIAVIKDYETYLKDPEARNKEIEALAAASGNNNNNDDDDADTNNNNNTRNANASKNKGPTAKERASAALAALKKKKMAKMSAFLPPDQQQQQQKDSEEKKQQHVDPTNMLKEDGASSSAAKKTNDEMSEPTTSTSMSASTSTMGDENADTAIVRNVVDGPALHRYVRSFIEDNVCVYCHRSGTGEDPLFHLGHISQSGLESHLCSSITKKNKGNNNNTNNNINDDDDADNSSKEHQSNEEVKPTLALNFCGHFAHHKCFKDRVQFVKAGISSASIFSAVRGNHYLVEGEVLCATCARIVSVAVPALPDPKIPATVPTKQTSKISREAFHKIFQAKKRAEEFALSVLEYETRYGVGKKNPSSSDEEEKEKKMKDDSDSDITIGSDDDDDDIALSTDKKKSTKEKKEEKEKETSSSSSVPVPYDLALSIIAPTLVNITLDLQLGKRTPMLREVSAYCSLLDILKRLSASKKEKEKLNNNNSSDASATVSAQQQKQLPPMSSVVQNLINATTLSMNCKLEDLLDGPLQHLSFSDVVSAGSNSNDSTAASFANSCLRLTDNDNQQNLLLETLTDARARLGVGAVSFWARMLLVLAQCATGRLIEPQLQSVAESVLRAASNSTTANSSSTESFLEHLHEIASNTITFPLWSVSAASSSSSSQDQQQTTNPADGNIIGNLDVEKESDHFETIMRFLEQKEDASPLTGGGKTDGDDDKQLKDDGLDENQQQQQQQQQQEGKDFIIKSLLSLFNLPSTYRELLPKMKQATKKDQNQEGTKSTVNEPLPDSDEEPDDEEERQRLEERKRMEREQQQREREANNNNNNSNNDDGSNEITVESEASYVCVKCGGVPRIPVMCLFTHQIYCARGTPAELCEHTEKVSGGCGLYMQMKVTQPLVLESGKRAQVEPSMYLDRFGEEDVSLRRGRPLMLNPERYRSFLRFAVRCSWDHHTAMLEDGGTWKTIQSL